MNISNEKSFTTKTKSSKVQRKDYYIFLDALLQTFS